MDDALQVALSDGASRPRPAERRRRSGRDVRGRCEAGVRADHVEPGSIILIDGWRGYRGLGTKGYTHKATSISASGMHAHVSMPAVHRVASLFKRSLLDAYQSYPHLHLQAYCDEWAFRFNRRSSTHRGKLFLRLLENAVECGPLEYSAITIGTKPRTVKLTITGRPGIVHTPTVNDSTRPWRS